METETEISNSTPSTKRKQRSDAGKEHAAPVKRRRRTKSAASALIDVVAALDGLNLTDISKVLSAAAIFMGVANFAEKK